jgi:arylsulfatase A-like enzyme
VYGHTRPTSPSIDEFSADGIRFDRAYSAAPWTKPSIASIMTGVHASTHTVQSLDRRLPRAATTLAERLKAAGYATAAVISHDQIGSKYAFDQGFDEFIEDDGLGHRHVSTNSVTERAIAQLDRLNGGEAPFFLFVHYFDPHFFFTPHGEYGFAGKRPPRLPEVYTLGKLRRLDPPLNDEEVRYLMDVYDEEIRYTDAGLGRLFSAMNSQGLFETSTVILTADHGEEFLEHGWLGHTMSVREELIRVPLIIRLPGGEASGSVVAEPVSLVAVTATVLDISGVESAAGVLQEGSLIPVIRGEAATASPVYAEVDFERSHLVNPAGGLVTAHLSMVVSGRYKLVLDRETNRYSLYDVVADPLEDHDLSQESPETLERLIPVLHEQMTAARSRDMEHDRAIIGKEDEEMLRGLGYID